MTQYPRDEFDRVPESATRQGVHRERLVPPHSNGLLLKVLAGLLVLMIGLAAFFLFPRLGLGQASETTAAGAAGNPTPTAEPTVEETPSENPAERPSEEPSEEPEASPSASATESSRPAPSESPAAEPTPEETEPAAVADRSQPVTVLNATTVGGLASTAAGRLQTDGWSVSQVGNWAGQPLQSSIVLYNGEEQRATAEELAAVLGIPVVQGNAGFASNITVVLGPGFQ